MTTAPLPRVSILLAAAVLSLSSLAACSGGPVTPDRDPTGIWTGALVTDEGTCPSERDSTLQINAHDISFTPGDGSIVLKGKRLPDNSHFRARAQTRGADGKPWPMVFDAYPVGRAIGGTYGTPACRAHITLTHPTR